jgi:hypothetical protein
MGEVIACILIAAVIYKLLGGRFLSEDPENEYMEFKRKLDALSEDERQQYFKHITVQYYFRYPASLCARYVTPNWAAMNEHRARVIRCCSRYHKEKCADAPGDKEQRT